MRITIARADVVCGSIPPWLAAEVPHTLKMMDPIVGSPPMMSVSFFCINDDMLDSATWWLAEEINVAYSLDDEVV